MHYTASVTLLFAVAALAAPAVESNIYSNDLPDGIYLPIETESIPSNIVSVLATAMPATWYQALQTDTAFQSSVLNDLLHSTYPAWYNSLPDSVKAWATTEAEAEVSAALSYMSDLPSFTASATSSSGSFGASYTGSSSPASSTPLATGHSSTPLSTSLTSTVTQITSISSSSSSSSSTTHSGTSTSSGGAAAATGGLAISFAGAAGVLGLALAL